ncbi:PepSY-like domain-containing protein [Pedobacter immunditicola]|uniref:PepSY-like domain-containing protein n=1 Tax=Pedobacter immunditicola TaxID=3133440 RepID=UPI00309EA90B
MNHKSTILAIFFLVGGIASSNAQDIAVKNLPAAVKTAFDKVFPEAKNVDWEMKGSNYEADFDIGRVDHKALYSARGKIISLEKDIHKSKLPANIAKSIKTKYPQGRIDDVDRIDTGGEITYKIDIEGTPDVVVWYAPDAKFIREAAD